MYSDTETDMYNDTETDMYKFFNRYYDINNSVLITDYKVLLFAVPFVFGITSNFIILIIIICNKDMRTLPNMYILNLAISDMIILTFLFFYVCVNRIPIFRLYDDIKLHSFHFALEYQSV